MFNKKLEKKNHIWGSWEPVESIIAHPIGKYTETGVYCGYSIEQYTVKEQQRRCTVCGFTIRTGFYSSVDSAECN